MRPGGNISSRATPLRAGSYVLSSLLVLADETSADVMSMSDTSLSSTAAVEAAAVVGVDSTSTSMFEPDSSPVSSSGNTGNIAGK